MSRATFVTMLLSSIVAWHSVTGCPDAANAADAVREPDGHSPSAGRQAAILDPIDTRSGYISALLVNEAAFPGERGWVGEADSKATMLAILWVLHGRMHLVPEGYARRELAATRSIDIVDVITAGGVRGQVDGFHRDTDGRFTTVRRVRDRIANLERIASTGEPGRFARLLIHARDLARRYESDGIAGADRYARLQRVGRVEVTGRAYAWMTDVNGHAPGGDFVSIPDAERGASGGNRFFTLRKRR